MTSQRSTFEPLDRRALLAADLYVTSTAITDGTVYSGEDPAGTFFTLNIAVQNLGADPAVGAIEVDIILSKDKHIDDAVDSITRMSQWENLFGGASDSAFHSPHVEGGQEPGYYYIGLRIDPTNQHAESDETNNVWWTRKKRMLIVTEAWDADSITGTAGNDEILVEEHFFQMFITVNGDQRAMDPDGTFDVNNKGVFIDAGPGNDRVAALNYFETRMQVTGNTGNDTLAGSGGNDELSGSFGYDRVLGGPGHDLLLGGTVNDYLNGEAGDDIMIGGGGNDRLVDSVGRDHFIGGAGNDILLTRDTHQTVFNNPDTLSGGIGADAAQVDVEPSADNLVSIETMMA